MAARPRPRKGEKKRSCQIKPLIASFVLLKVSVSKTNTLSVNLFELISKPIISNSVGYRPNQ